MPHLPLIQMKTNTSNWYFSPYYLYAPSIGKQQKEKQSSDSSRDFREILKEQIEKAR